MINRRDQQRRDQQQRQQQPQVLVRIATRPGQQVAVLRAGGGSVTITQSSDSDQ